MKLVVKNWHATHLIDIKQKEERLLRELEIIDELAENVGLNEVELAHRSAIQTELLCIYRTEERNFIQKSKLNWLAVGDENTGFFHRFLNAKK